VHIFVVAIWCVSGTKSCVVVWLFIELITRNKLLIIEKALKCSLHFREIRRLCCIVLLVLGNQDSEIT